MSSDESCLDDYVDKNQVKSNFEGKFPCECGKTHKKDSTRAQCLELRNKRGRRTDMGDETLKRSEISPDIKEEHKNQTLVGNKRSGYNDINMTDESHKRAKSSLVTAEEFHREVSLLRKQIQTIGKSVTSNDVNDGKATRLCVSAEPIRFQCYHCLELFTSIEELGQHIENCLADKGFMLENQKFRKFLITELVHKYSDELTPMLIRKMTSKDKHQEPTIQNSSTNDVEPNEVKGISSKASLHISSVPLANMPQKMQSSRE